MTYFEGFIVPVPEANKDAYRKHASEFAPIAREFGVGRHVEAWESDVPEGKLTDFRKAVEARPDEKIVFAWFEYPSKRERDATNEKMMSDPRMEDMGKNMPFDGKRMIMGGFESIVDEGEGGGRYTDGWVVPVPTSKRDAYRELAQRNAKYFREYGATRLVEASATMFRKARSPTFTAPSRPKTAKTSCSRSSSGRTSRPATRPGKRS